MAPVTMAQANKALKNLPEDIALGVRTVTGVTAYNVMSSARDSTPVSAGQPQGRMHLKEAITWGWTGKLAAVVRVAKEAFHWKFLEYGTVHMRAYGMFRKAKDQHSGDHHSRLMQALQQAQSRLGL